MRVPFLIAALASLAISTVASAQFALGNWRDHLPYNRCIDITYAHNDVFVATKDGVFSYDLDDKSIQRFNKTKLLNDVGISTLASAEAYEAVLVGYENGNLDILFEESSINLADIKRSDQSGSKRINDIELDGNLAYIATGFGIVVLDLDRVEVKETYIIGPGATPDNMLDIEINNGMIYSLSPDRIYRAELSNPFLIDFQTWDQITPTGTTGPLQEMEFFQDQLLAVTTSEEDNETLVVLDDAFAATTTGDFINEPLRHLEAYGTRLLLSANDRVHMFDQNLEVIRQYALLGGELIRPMAAIMTPDSTMWTADRDRGLVGQTLSFSSRVILPDGPANTNARRLDAYNDNIWIASGGVDASWTPNYDKFGAYGLVNEQWKFIPAEDNGLNEIAGINDIMDVAVNPIDNSTVLLASWEEGLVETKNGELQTIYNSSNSTLESSPFAGAPARTGVSSVAYDLLGNAWIANTYSEHPLHLLTAGGEFTAFDFDDIGEEDLISDVFVTSNGYVWIILPRRGLLVLNPNETPANTSDDQSRLLTTEEGNGGLPAGEVFCIEEDLDGEVWVGTLQGPAVFYSPTAIFESEEFDAQQVRIEQDGNVQLLLETETITSIEVDGANRKWFATENSGVFLQSDDGLVLIEHLTTVNSPLFSDNVTDIAYNHGTGELYFATINGILSLTTDASNFVSEITDITVYPNPVEPTFGGDIRIDGFAYDTNIKITDAAGHVVFGTTSNGGRATWDGRSFSGDPVSPGVYLIFAGTNDDSTSQVGKIAILR